jgi:hypothetical protein
VSTEHARYRAGASVEDHCRACKTDRTHTVIVVDERGWPMRVSCDYCGSQHNFRGGGRIDTGRTAATSRQPAPAPAPARAPRDAFPIVSDHERSAPAMSLPESGVHDLELLLRRIIREEAGVTPVTPAPKWRGGTLVLRAGTAGMQEKSWPIETFFHKIVMLRNRLRTLEQQVNASDLPEDAKVKLQAYVSACYGSLTSFNVLFADEHDQYRGSGGD